jgi:glyoxylase-like metal-dependent hydrolase (beta-lactamase superfamily II)
MDRLWGAFEPVPQANIRALAGGETVTAVGRTLQTAYTPGHASHHIAYFDTASRIAFVGDVGGVSLPPAHIIVPPTPPPDIDIELWERSIETVLAWQPEALFLAHFGLKSNPAIHLQELLERLRSWARIVQHLASEPSEDVRRAKFARQASLDLRRSVSEADMSRYGLAINFDQTFNGLERYWKKRAERLAAGH